MRCLIWLLFALSVLALDDDELVVEEEAPAEQVPAFVPTNEWQVIAPGQAIPPGLHVRVSMTTGLKEAKLWDRFPQDQRRSNHYGHSDRRGIVNKRSKAFTKEEYFKMLQESKQALPYTPALTYIEPNNQVASLKNPESKSSLSPSTIPNLPVTVHSEVAAIVTLTNSLLSPSTSVPELLVVLEELEYHVHEIDNGRDLVSVGGLPVLLRLLNHSEPDVQSSAALVIGSAAQSNPEVQEGVLLLNGLKTLCCLLLSTQPDIVQRRGLFALGAVLRGTSNLLDCAEFDDLRATLNSRSTRVKLKTAILVTDLAEQLGLKGHDWCVPVAGLIYSEDMSLVIAGLGALGALHCDCSSYRQRLLELSDDTQLTELIQPLLVDNVKHQEL